MDPFEPFAAPLHPSTSPASPLVAHIAAPLSRRLRVHTPTRVLKLIEPGTYQALSRFFF